MQSGTQPRHESSNARAHPALPHGMLQADMGSSWEPVLTPVLGARQELRPAVQRELLQRRYKLQLIYWNTGLIHQGMR